MFVFFLDLASHFVSLTPLLLQQSQMQIWDKTVDFLYITNAFITESTLQNIFKVHLCKLQAIRKDTQISCQEQ